MSVEFSDTDAVQLVAQAVYHTQGSEVPWADLSHRARKHRCERAKIWLNTRAVDCMTPELLQQRDPKGEVSRLAGHDRRALGRNG